MIEKRARLFSIILYEDTTDYDIKDVLFNIKSQKYYAYILHNKDTDNKGQFKKAHYHIIIRLDNASTIQALSKKIGIKENYIQVIKNERSYIRHLYLLPFLLSLSWITRDLIFIYYYSFQLHIIYNVLNNYKHIIIIKSIGFGTLDDNVCK